MTITDVIFCIGCGFIIGWFSKGMFFDNEDD